MKGKAVSGVRAGARSKRSWAAVLRRLARAYGRSRRSARRRGLDLCLLAVLAEGRGERVALAWLGQLARRFVDWNEVRVAKPRDLKAAVPEAPPARLARAQVLLQSLYEARGGLTPNPLADMRPAEARARLAEAQVLDREEIDAVLMIALGAPTLPAGESLSRVARRLGLAPRTATKARVQKLALKGLAPAAYREFYSLAGEHAAARCRAENPECRRCRLRAGCRSKGRW